MTFLRYRDRTGQWRWQLKGRNGFVIAEAPKGYNTPGDCKRAIEAVRKCGTAKVVDRDGCGGVQT